MSQIYEKARAIAEGAANGWDKFGDTAGVNWLTVAIMEFGALPRDDGRCMCAACQDARGRSATTTARTPAGAAGDPKKTEIDWQSFTEKPFEETAPYVTQPASPAPTPSPESTLSPAQVDGGRTIGASIIRAGNEAIRAGATTPASAGEGDLREAASAWMAAHPASIQALGNPMWPYSAVVEAFLAGAALARHQAPAVDVPAERDRIARIIFDAFYDGPMGDEFDNPGYAHSRTLAEKAADAILATRPTDPGGARGENKAARPITHADVADALDHFWNAALAPAHNEQPTVACLVEGVAAVAGRFREMAAASTASSDAGGAE